MEELTPRLEQILTAVVQYHIATGRPVGSKYLSRQAGFSLSPSTLRCELARLERMGYLDHPHTSAGRMPTDLGYRYYVDHYFQERRREREQAQARQRQPEPAGGQIEDALQQAAAWLAEKTGLLALVSAPMRNNSAIKHVEVLQLNPDVVMVVVITASGGVTKKILMYPQPVDPGLVDWARGYLNDALGGIDLGSRRLRLYFEQAELGGLEAEFLHSLEPAFAEEPKNGSVGLYIEGVPRFLSRLERDSGVQTNSLMRALDRREEILHLLTSELMQQRVYLRIGREMPAGAMQGCSLVAANYGVTRRNLGTVGVLGPTRMDYVVAIGSVELSARSLSLLVEEFFN